MKTQKMSFKNIKDVLNRDEMRTIMAGSGGGGGGCNIRCDRNSDQTKPVPDCSSDTARQACGSDLSNVVCIC